MRRAAVFIVLTIVPFIAAYIAGAANDHASGAADGQNAGAAKDYARATDAAPYATGTIPALTLHDAKRNTDVPVLINYPQGDGPFPVIIFSHGAWGSKEGYRPLTAMWAGHGYITIQPDHADARTRGTQVGDPSVFRDWQDRPADISFVLDMLDHLEAVEPKLRGKLDKQHIGVGGHSFGANTAQLIGGAMAYLPTGPKSLADSRVVAVILLSGQGPGEMLTVKSWEGFSQPMLVMTGSADGPSRTGQPAIWRTLPYVLSPAGDKYLVWVEGMDHGFGGISGLANGLAAFKRNPDHVMYTQMATLAFWDTYLKGDPGAAAYLKSGQLPAFSQGEVRLEYK